MIRALLQRAARRVVPAVVPVATLHRVAMAIFRLSGPSEDEQEDALYLRGAEDNDREWVHDLAELLDLDAGWVGRAEVVRAVKELPHGGRSVQEAELARDLQEARDALQTAHERLRIYGWPKPVPG